MGGGHSYRSGGAFTLCVVVEEGNTACVSSGWLGVSISIEIGVDNEGSAVLVPCVSHEDRGGVVTSSGVVMSSLRYSCI